MPVQCAHSARLRADVRYANTPRSASMAIAAIFCCAQFGAIHESALEISQRAVLDSHPSIVTDGKKLLASHFFSSENEAYNRHARARGHRRQRRPKIRASEGLKGIVTSACAGGGRKQGGIFRWLRAPLQGGSQSQGLAMVAACACVSSISLFKIGRFILLCTHPILLALEPPV